MPFNAVCSKQPPIGLAIALISLSACATGGSDPGGLAVCPPLVEYDQAFRERVARELELLPEGAAIVEVLGDYAMHRRIAAVCLTGASGSAIEG